MSFPLHTSTSTSLSYPLSPQPTQPSLSYNNPRNLNLSLKPTVAATDPTVSWTSTISHHCRNGSINKAISKFTQMRLENIEPNHITFVSLISACAHFPSHYTLSLGLSLHAYVSKLGLDKNNVKVGTAIVGFYSKHGLVDLARIMFDRIYLKNKVTWNSMLDGYMRNGDFEAAVKVFDEMPHRDEVSWTAMINGYLKKREFEICLDWFVQMQVSGVKPDYVTIVSVLSACAGLGALGLGFWVHKFVLDNNLGDNLRVSNSLIDMYSRCGCIGFASHVFWNMRVRNLVSWNSMIVGFSMNGYAKEAIEFFDLMQKEGFEPDGVSFTGALTACSHSGLVIDGLNIFDKMIKVYKLSPRIEHYGCIIDLYSRAGRLEDALSVIKDMPLESNEVIIGSVLAACVTHGDVNLAESLMDYLHKLDPELDSNFVLLSNIYAAVGSWDGANSVRKKMKDMGIKKKPGISSIEVHCGVHEFVAGDKSHADTEHIYGMLELLRVEDEIHGSFRASNVGELYDVD